VEALVGIRSWKLTELAHGAEASERGADRETRKALLGDGGLLLAL
jgi:hypothetical protein